MRPVAIGILALLVVGCGSQPTPTGATEPVSSVEPAPAADAAPAELAVTISRAMVVGELSGEVVVEAHPVGLLDPDGATPTLMTFTASQAGDVLLPSYPFFSVGVSAADGSGRLGIAGVCGLGWQEDGAPVEDDPCAAASPVMDVPAGEAFTLLHRLYTTIEEGTVAPGRYDASIPLAPGSTLAAPWR